MRYLLVRFLPQKINQANNWERNVLKSKTQQRYRGILSTFHRGSVY